MVEALNQQIQDTEDELQFLEDESEQCREIIERFTMLERSAESGEHENEEEKEIQEEEKGIETFL